MRSTRSLWRAALCVWVVGCSRDEPPTPPPPGAPSTEIALPGAVIMIGAGDIAVCGTTQDERTARIVDSVIAAAGAAKVEAAVFTLGDNAYPSGPAGPDEDLPKCFATSWGSPRIMNVIHPAPGNHDYDSGSGDPYFSYFGERAGPPGKGYYSYDVGAWHAISLNSELYFEAGDESDVRAQEDWLRKDLKDHPSRCTLAYFHRPLFSSGDYGTSRQMRPLWEIMQKGGVDLVLNGHEHHYERFLPQKPDGVADSANGITEIISGTGGAKQRGVHRPLAPNSSFQIHGRFGVLKLSLGTDEYRHAFLDTDGRVWDGGSGRCH